MMLPDVVQPGLRVVFCGTAAGTRSAQLRSYYAGSGNQFWTTLARVGLTPRRLAPDEYMDLPRYGIGLTDLCKLRAGSDRQVGSGGFDVERLVGLLERHRPAAVAFNGKKAAEVALDGKVEYGEQHWRLAGARTFVLPSTSGAARGFWDEKRWQELADAVTG
jgi:double-stranded uracil-DNA glycosylase